MSLSTRKGTFIGNSNLRSLNPNAVEFVPFSQRLSPGSPSTADILSSQKSSRSEAKGKSVLDRSESSISDDEVHRYWRQQLPDDIIPDFNVMRQEEPHVTNDLPFANLSLQENHDVSRFSSSSGSRFIMKDQVELPLRSSVPSYGGDASSTNFIHYPTKPWVDPVLKNDLLTSNGGSLYNGSSSHRRPLNALPDQTMVEVPLYSGGSAQRRSPISLLDQATVEVPLYSGSSAQRRSPIALPDQATVEVPPYSGSSAQRRPPISLLDLATVEVPPYSGSSAQRRSPISLLDPATIEVPPYSGSSAQRRSPNAPPDQAPAEVPLYNGSSAQRRPPNVLPPDLATVDVPTVSPIELLALQFPGISADNLAEVYFTNGCDLSLTFDALSQSEGEVRFAEPLFPPLEFPSLAAVTGSDGSTGAGRYSGEETLVQPFSPYRSTSRGAVDFSLRSMASRDSNIGRYDRIGSPDATVGSNNTNLFGQARGTTGDGFQVRTSPRATPSWLEAGEAVGNVYSEPREEIRDHARLRNAYFEQARQAYFIGNKVLAKEMSMKGQIHNLHLKAATHGNTHESLIRHRNTELMMQQQLSGGRVHERVIDLQGLHANEAIHILNRELTLLKVAVRSEDHIVQVYIFVGSINQARGSRLLPGRLPIVVQRYLMEEEGLEFTESQPGVLRVVIR